MHWTDLKLIGAILAGLVVALLLSTAQSLKARLAGVAAGIFFAVLFTQPLIAWAHLQFTTWQYAVAGLLAMSGDRLARRIMSLIDTASVPWGGR